MPLSVQKSDALILLLTSVTRFISLYQCLLLPLYTAHRPGTTQQPHQTLEVKLISTPARQTRLGVLILSRIAALTI